MEISQVLKPERILLHLQAKTKEEALEKMTDLLEQTGALTDKKAFLEDVMERERVSSTGIGNGIAIPHGKSKFVKETTVAIASLENNNIEWETFDDQPISLIVLLAVDEEDKTGGHVRLLSQMARKLASPETCRRLTEAQTVEEIVKVFS
ncbi:MAG: PTS sugar transporter subunit IIA [Clostridia bacterium]|nr:PTS sugar transporter subunit IIA [Clostridia bacterium]